MRVILLLVLSILCLLPLSDGRGGRGGGGRGGGSRGSSSRGSSSRGSSSSGSSSSSRGSTSSHRTSTYYDRKSSDKSSSADNGRIKPSAPELPVAKPKPFPNLPPSAPKLPPAPVQPPYNPNYGKPLPYPTGNVGPPGGPPPPYPGPAKPPPYPGPVQPRPPPYDFNQNQPNPNVGNVPYPRQPNIGNPSYPQRPPPYPQQPNYGNVPINGQRAPYPHGSFGSRPYPQQPGGYYPPPPSYTQYSSLAGGSHTYSQPQPKKGLLGQVMSLGKTPKHPGGYPKYGGYSKGGHGMSPYMYPIIPLMAAKKLKPHKMFHSPFSRPIFFMPYYMPHYGYHGYYGHHHYGDFDFDNDRYRGGCRRPIVPKHAFMECNGTEYGVKCRMTCNTGFQYAVNVTEKENECWHIGGVWRPFRNFAACKPICEEECENGGKCIGPGLCRCGAEYRGEKCQYNVLSCDIRKLAGKASNNISWSCRHGRNDTVCHVRCRSTLGMPSEQQNVKELRCTPEGEWTAAELPKCNESDHNATESLSASTTETLLESTTETVLESTTETVLESTTKPPSEENTESP